MRRLAKFEPQMIKNGRGRVVKMYCPTCGVETSQGLNYCKACGASLSARSDIPARRSLSFKEMFLFLVVASLGVIGPIGLFIESDDLMKSGRVPIGVFTIMFGFGAVLSFLTLLLLAWLFLRLTSTSSSTWYLPDIRRKDKSLPGGQHQIPQIRRSDESAPSVTEHTTRNFEQSFRGE